MKPIFLIAVLCSWIQAQAPAPHRFGAIDGVSIPEKELNVPRETAVADYVRTHSQQPSPSSEAEVQKLQDRRLCRNLQSVVQDAAAKRAKGELGIFATDAEVAARHSQLPAASKDEQIRFRERLQALVAGLTAVYDQGQDPQQVYQQLVAPHNVTQSDWAENLNTRRTKEERQKLARALAGATPEGFAKAAANYDARPAVESDKLNAAVDAQLAASDPTFKADLNEWNAKAKHPTPNETSITIRGEVKEYLEQKRAAWWKAEIGKLNVTLSDPSLYVACNLPAFGVTVPRH